MLVYIDWMFASRVIHLSFMYTSCGSPANAEHLRGGDACMLSLNAGANGGQDRGLPEEALRARGWLLIFKFRDLESPLQARLYVRHRPGGPGVRRKCSENWPAGVLYSPPRSGAPGPRHHCLTRNIRARAASWLSRVDHAPLSGPFGAAARAPGRA